MSEVRPLRRALVTGVAGFVGSAIARRLTAEGVEVVGVDAFRDYYDVRIKEANVRDLPAGRFTLVHGDLNEVDLAPLLDVDAVFHQAGQPGVRQSWGSDFATYTRDNVDATQRLLEACRLATRIQRIVYASSSSVYGSAERYPTTESDRPRPLSPYGVTKLAGEHLAVLYAENYGLPTVALRYFTVFGPGQRPDMAFSRFARAALTGGPIHVFGTGEQIRDFTFVDDVVEANLAAATRDPPPGSVFNVAGGSSTSVNEVLEILARLVDRPIDVTRADAVPGDVSRTAGSTEAIEAALAWRARVGLEDGLARQVAWMRDVLADGGSAQ